MQRWLAIILVPMAFLAALSILATTKMITPGENLNIRSSLSELELGYMVGSGIPVQRRDYGMRPGGDDDDNDDSKGGGGDDEDRSPQSDNNIVSDTEEEEIERGGEEEETEGREKEDNDNKDLWRPKKKPKGKKWKGWRLKPHGDDERNAAKSDNQSGSNTKQQNLPNNIGDSEQWWRKSRSCFEVDYICHGQEKNDWFYYTPSNSKQQHQNLFQPTMELKSAPAKYDGGKDRGENRISINVASSSKVKPISIDDNSNKCHVSSTPTHIVLQSLFNDMIGEFYSRTLLKLYHFMTDSNNNQNVNNNNNNNNNDDDDGKHKKPWEEDIQFYVHIPYGNKKMLDGHKLLLSGMLSNPDSPSARSLTDLFVREEGGEDGDDGGEESGDCQCYEKMVFCGYDVYAHDSEVKSKDLEPAVEDDDDDDDAEESDIASDNEAASNPASFNYDTKYTLWSAGKLDGRTELDSGSCGRSTGTKGTEYECQSWNGLRNFLSNNFIQHYPTLKRDLAKRRRELLVEKGAIDDGYTGDTKEFTVIGFTQRTYRRAWLNLPSILELCNDEAVSLERAICVEINVENASTPFEQLLLHRSLDVMVGVHGAQLTQAILLPDHAHILELLPWITDYIRGKWVQTKHGPTPLGIIFHNTNLNHVGFSLDRNSVPLCEGVPETALQLCFMKQKRNFIWENRDFNVESKAMLQYIQDFVLFGREKERTCEELKDALDDRFVLYNVWCSKPSYWYPIVVEGEKDCVHGTEYKIDHTDKFLADLHLFDSKDKCCDAFPSAWCSKPSYWYPTMLEGEKACVYGKEYPIDGTEKLYADRFLSDSKDKCCDAFPDACKNERESNDREQKKSAGNAIALFHNYHKLSPTAVAEGAVSEKGRRKKQKKQKENKKFRHR